MTNSQDVDGSRALRRCRGRRPWVGWASAVMFFSGAFVTSCLADERLEATYIPGLYSHDSVMINGPQCLGLQEGGVQFGSAECSPDVHTNYLDVLRQWRAKRRFYIGYDGSRYDMPALQWTQSSFIQPQAMVEDRYLYDSTNNRYTIDRYLDDVNRRYGGIDSILLWPVYPNLGIDNRNQLDMIRAMPGGVAGVKAMIAEFHHRGIRVLFPMNMWDQGTRRAMAGRDRGVDEGNRRRWRQRRHAARCTAGVSSSRGSDRPSTRLSAGRVLQRRRGRLEHFIVVGGGSKDVRAVRSQGISL